VRSVRGRHMDGWLRRELALVDLTKALLKAKSVEKEDVLLRRASHRSGCHSSCILHRPTQPTQTSLVVDLSLHAPARHATAPRPVGDTKIVESAVTCVS